MGIKLIKMLINLIYKIPLRSRFIIILIVNSLVTSLLVGTVSYYNIKSLNENKVKSGIQSTLNSISINIDNAYENLNSISKQFAYEDNVVADGGIQSELREYVRYLDEDIAFSNEQIIYFARIGLEIQQKTTFITSTNPIVGLTLFYRLDKEGKKQLLFSNADSISSEVNRLRKPVLVSTDLVTFYGIHRSLSNNKSNVLSIERKIEVAGTEGFYIYMEVDDRWLENLINDKQYGMNSTFIMTDADNSIVFSENPEVLAVGSVIDMELKPDSSGFYEDYYIFNGPKESGWKVMEVINKGDYNKEIVEWTYQILLIIIISLFVAGIMVLVIWKSVYRPINVFKREFQLMADNQLVTKIRRTRVKEFDELLMLFYKARENNLMLLRQIELKERKQQELEIEKLLIQINPHFLHNTLNSIHWMARLNNQKDIERMTTLFSRVLNYNLGKSDIIVTVSEEINALNNYIELQRMRFGTNLNVIINVQQILKEVRIPRFIIQPLVENSIFHGMNENGTIIRIHITQEQDMMLLCLEDNGPGMTDAEIKKLLSENKCRNIRDGMGIGLKYVNGMIKHYYGDQYGIKIDSEIGEGTRICILLPLTLKEDTNDQSTDC